MEIRYASKDWLLIILYLPTKGGIRISRNSGTSIEIFILILLNVEILITTKQPLFCGFFNGFWQTEIEKKI